MDFIEDPRIKLRIIIGVKNKIDVIVDFWPRTLMFFLYLSIKKNIFGLML